MTAARPTPTGTGILVVPAIASEAEVLQILRQWGQGRPNDASVVVARYQGTGHVHASIYAVSGQQALLWTGEIGNVNAAELPAAVFGTAAFQQQIDGPVRRLVGTFLGIAPM
jgi:hypothetical protein